MVSRCKEIGNLLPLAILGEAEPSAIAQIHAHLERCDTCRGDADRLRSFLGTLSTAEVPDPGAVYWENFLPRLRSRIAAEGPSTMAPPRLAWAFAASAAVFLLAGTLVGRWQPAGSELGTRLEKLVRRSDPGELRWALEDVFPGSDVSLSGRETSEAVPTADEMERALEAVIPPDDGDLDIQLDDLPPEACQWLVQALGPARGYGLREEA